MISRLSETSTIDLGNHVYVCLDEAAMDVRGSDATEEQKHFILASLQLAHTMISLLIKDGD